MDLVSLLLALCVALSCALGIWLQNPVRGLLCLLAAVASLAGLVSTTGSSFTASAVLFFACVPVFLLLFVALLLNLTKEERGTRRFSILRLLALALVLFVAAGIAPSFLSLPSASPAMPVLAADISRVLFHERGIVLLLAGFGLAGSAGVALIASRRTL